MSKETLDRAIKKGSGAGADAVNYSSVIFEGYGPHRVPVMVECLTDNPNRTAPNLRVCFRKGQLTAVAWDFDHVGMIEGEPASADTDMELAAIEAGAQDFEPGDEEGTTLFITEPTDLDLVSKALPEQGVKVLSAKLGYKAKNPISAASLSAEAMEEVQAFLAGFENDDDTQNVYAGLVD
ncbi:putative transcriptional regulatory protein YebC [bioreactor metagenome]|uniref:Putative transcriptional regulatory protein YebC n=1 Tax=bioreactor metagenome TaxID=1076179 RepID=A0A645FZR2_9ZZZZ